MNYLLNETPTELLTPDTHVLFFSSSLTGYFQVPKSDLARVFLYLEEFTYHAN